jgi:hypothetical protein
MVKVFFITGSFATAESGPVRIVAPTAAEPARISRREGISLDVRGMVAFPSDVMDGSEPTFFIVIPSCPDEATLSFLAKAGNSPDRQIGQTASGLPPMLILLVLLARHRETRLKTKIARCGSPRNGLKCRTHHHPTT